MTTASPAPVLASEAQARANMLAMSVAGMNRTQMYVPTRAERLSRMFWRFWYTARPIVLGALGAVLGSILSMAALYALIGWNIADEMEERGVEFTSLESYLYVLATWPRAVAKFLIGG